MQLMANNANKLTQTSGIYGHNIDETQQLPQAFKFYTTNLYTPANATFMSSGTASASC